MSRTILYRPEIDGLRTIAVMAVIIFHLKAEWLIGGFLGVDVFFVISGFLITSIIYAQIQKSVFSITEFWMRRIRRLYPALICMVAIVLLAGAFFLIQPERGQLPLQAIGAVLSFENILLWRTTGGYWDSSSENISLLHTWSLSLEEQFYICFPILLVIIHKAAKGKEQIVLLVLLVLSLVLCLYTTETYRSATFYLLPTRMWELLMGGILGIYMLNNSRKSLRFSWLIQILGMAMIVVSFVVIKNDESFPSAWPVLPCLGTMCILRYGFDRGPIHSFLSFKPIVYVGKLSYSLYLWHWPIIVFLQYTNPESTPWLALLLTFVMAMLSYHFIEGLYRGVYRKPKLATAIIFGTMAAFILPIIFLPQSPLIKGLGDIDSEEAMSRGWEFEATQLIRDGEAGVIVNGDLARPDLCIIGSSHARVLCSPVADYAVKEGLHFISMAASGIGITTTDPTTRLPDPEHINQTRFRFVKELNPRVVIVAGRWSSENENLGFEGKLKAGLADLCSYADHVIVLGQVPLISLPEGYDKAMRKYIVAQSISGRPISLKPDLDVVGANTIVEGSVKSLGRSNISYINPYSLFLNTDGTVRVFKDENILYSDFHHVNDRGASYILDQLLLHRVYSNLMK